MKTQLDMDKIAQGLGAERRGKVASTRGYFFSDAAPGRHRGPVPCAVRWGPAHGPRLDRAAALPLALRTLKREKLEPVLARLRSRARDPEVGRQHAT
jgi:hypothetical protein